MSWLTLAKSALKEAQKQIDKALDIKEIEERDVESQEKNENVASAACSSQASDSTTFEKFECKNSDLTIDNNILEDIQGQNELNYFSIRGNNEVVLLSASTEDNNTDVQTIDSDSTQSFEEVQMVITHPNKSTTDQTLKENCNHIYSLPSVSDEIETNTSSDIEIISNPNGDSSSNSTTRTSPLKFKEIINNNNESEHIPISMKLTNNGHYREPSEISIISEDSQTEIDKLLHRINELNEIIESRELSLVQSGQKINSLEEKNNQLQLLIDKLNSCSSTINSPEEYTRRLSSLEKKFQNSIRERDSLQTYIKNLKEEAVDKIQKEEFDRIVNENNAMISELRLEGEKLSKNILQQSNIIKKLRQKEKASDTILKKNKHELSIISEEIERLKKTLHAKEDVERTQIEVVHKLSSEKRRLEDEHSALLYKVEDLETKLNTIQTNFNAVKIELHNRSQQHSDLSRTVDEVVLTKKEKNILKVENLQLSTQLTELRKKLQCHEIEMTRKEKMLRDENKELLKKFEEAESRSQKNAEEINYTTIPIMRQLDSLQNILTQRTQNWVKEEKILLEKLDKANNKIKSFESVEKTYKDKVVLLKSKCKDLEEQISQCFIDGEKFKIQLHQLEENNNLKEKDCEREISRLKEELLSLTENQKLLAEAKVEYTEKRLSHSPGVSSDGNSMVDNATTSIDWNTLDDLEPTGFASIEPINSLVSAGHMNLGGHSSSTIEHLNSMLKQKDGELSQYQWEIGRLQTEKNLLNNELSNITLELETIKENIITQQSREKVYNDLQKRYDALLQMYGEKVERTEELELDLFELKEEYKRQIEELLSPP